MFNWYVNENQTSSDFLYYCFQINTIFNISNNKTGLYYIVIYLTTLTFSNRWYRNLTLIPPFFGMSMLLLHRGHGNFVLYFPFSTYLLKQLPQKEWRQDKSFGSWNLSVHIPHFNSFFASLFLAVCFPVCAVCLTGWLLLSRCFDMAFRWTSTRLSEGETILTFTLFA